MKRATILLLFLFIPSCALIQQERSPSHQWFAAMKTWELTLETSIAYCENPDADPCIKKVLVSYANHSLKVVELGEAYRKSNAYALLRIETRDLKECVREMLKILEKK